MYLLYLDDSGSVKNLTEDYFVLGGICLPEKSIRWLSYEIEKLAQQYDAQDPTSVEFHAAEIFGGRTHPWDQYRNKKDRITIIQSVLHTLDAAFPSIVAFACAVHKASFPNNDPVLMAFEDITSRFDMYIHRMDTDLKDDQRGMIVIDKSSYETSLQNLTMSFRHEGNRWGSYLKKICEVPMFVDSKVCRLMQLADHIAYAVFRYYNAEDMSYFNCIANRFDQKDGIIHGLSHLQRSNPMCMCPACLTRRQGNGP